MGIVHGRRGTFQEFQYSVPGTQYSVAALEQEGKGFDLKGTKVHEGKTRKFWYPGFSLDTDVFKLIAAATLSCLLSIVTSI